MKAAVAIDDWKLAIFERHLTQAGYSFVNAGYLTAGCIVLQVTTSNMEALGEVVKAAYAECTRTGKPEGAPT